MKAMERARYAVLAAKAARAARMYLLRIPEFKRRGREARMLKKAYRAGLMILAGGAVAA